MQATKHILVVDNDEVLMLALDKEIRELGHNPVTTWSGVEALSLLKANRFDVLLVDDYLADMYVGDFLGRVSQLPLRPKIWVMQAKPAQDVCVYGPRCFFVVRKRRATQIFQQLANGIDGSVLEPSAWKQ